MPLPLNDPESAYRTILQKLPRNPKKLDTPAGTVTLDVPKTRDHDGAPFYPQSLERGRRSCRAVIVSPGVV